MCVSDLINGVFLKQNLVSILFPPIILALPVTKTYASA